MSKKDSKLVYSTDAGRIKSIDPLPNLPPKSDGFVRIRRETAMHDGHRSRGRVKPPGEGLATAD